MRLIRGTGLYGLISMLPKRKIGNFTIIRPLIDVSRSEVESYLKKIRLKPRIDRSNFNKKFLRNKIRHNILNDLTKVNPNIKDTLARFAQQAAIDYDYLYSNSARFVNRKSKARVKINLKSLIKQNIKAGYHEVEFNADDLSSGIYLYRLEAGSFSDIRKMIILK